MLPKRRFRPREDDLTVCVAGIHDQSPRKLIIACFDRRLTTLGGAHSSDGSIWKMRTVHKNWWALMSGRISDGTSFGYALGNGLRENVPENFIDFARHCVGLYKQERIKLIETEVLALYDIDSYTDYRSLRSTDRDYYDAISGKISEFDEAMTLMMCGFDNDGAPHIFVIYGPGHLSFCDTQGYGVIGSGNVAAQISLDKHPYNKWLRLGECIFAVLAAKFSAEPAEGVGPDSILFVFRQGEQKLQAVLKDDAILDYKKQWKSLPKIPDGVVDDLEENMEIYDRELENTKPSDSEM